MALLAACGSDAGDEYAAPRANTEASETPTAPVETVTDVTTEGATTGKDAPPEGSASSDEPYESARQSCRAFPLRKLAHDLGTDPNPTAVAEAFARMYEGEKGERAYFGCLTGIRERD